MPALSTADGGPGRSRALKPPSPARRARGLISTRWSGPWRRPGVGTKGTGAHRVSPSTAVADGAATLEACAPFPTAEYPQDGACYEKARADGWPDFFSLEPLQIARALTICEGCTVRAECCAGAVERREEDGVWGGFDLNPPGGRQQARRWLADRNLLVREPAGQRLPGWGSYAMSRS